MFSVSGFEEDGLTWSPDKKQPNLDEYKEFNQRAQAQRSKKYLEILNGVSVKLLWLFLIRKPTMVSRCRLPDL